MDLAKQGEGPPNLASSNFGPQETRLQTHRPVELPKTGHARGVPQRVTSEKCGWRMKDEIKSKIQEQDRVALAISKRKQIPGTPGSGERAAALAVSRYRATNLGTKKFSPVALRAFPNSLISRKEKISSERQNRPLLLIILTDICRLGVPRFYHGCTTIVPRFFRGTFSHNVDFMRVCKVGVPRLYHDLPWYNRGTKFGAATEIVVHCITVIKWLKNS
jgi:hypothetical protein